jgi:glycosyltransferase involved in cell wall biosynthesis
MKILQITFSLAPGGAERFVVDLSNELSKNNDVTLLTLKDDKVDVENRNFYKFDLSPRVKYMNLGLGDGFHPLYLIQIYKVIKDFNPDVVHFHGCNMIKYVYYACL